MKKLIFVFVLLVLVGFSIGKLTGNFVSEELNKEVELCELELIDSLSEENFEEKFMKCNEKINLRLANKESDYLLSKKYFFLGLRELDEDNAKIENLKKALKNFDLSLYYNTDEKTLRIYEETTKKLNEIYDEEFEFEAKYSLQVDSSSKVLREKVSEIVGGEKSLDERKWLIFNFIKENIEYEYESSLSIDFVQTPVFTLITKKGDCDDFAVLLASMFDAAGVDKLEICHADVDLDKVYDHVFISSGDVAWDATNQGEGSIAKDFSNWNLKCKNLVRIFEEPEFSKLTKCGEGYVLGEDNKCHETCGKGDNYCLNGECCEGKCYSCPKGYLLNESCYCLSS